MSKYRFPLEIRKLIQSALPQETSLFGGAPELKYTYLPQAMPRRCIRTVCWLSGFVGLERAIGGQRSKERITVPSSLKTYRKLGLARRPTFHKDLANNLLQTIIPEKTPLQVY